MNLDFSRAVNITWNRKDRNRLPLLHHELCEAARTWGLDRLYRLAVLAFAGTGGRPRDRLETLAQGARQAGDYFPFSADVMACMRSFVPTKWPSSDQLQEARAAWPGGVAKARSSTLDNSSPGVKPIDWRNVAFGPEDVTHGAGLIRRGIRDYQSWSEQMVRRYGASVEERLSKIYREAEIQAAAADAMQEESRQLLGPSVWRPLEDAAWLSNAVKEDAMLALEMAYNDLKTWNAKRLRLAVEAIATFTVKEILGAIEQLPKEVRDQCRNVNNTKEALDAANAAQSATYECIRSAAPGHPFWEIERVADQMGYAAMEAAWGAMKAAWALQESAMAAAKAAEVAKKCGADPDDVLRQACGIWITAAEWAERHVQQSQVAKQAQHAAKEEQRKQEASGQTIDHSKIQEIISQGPERIGPTIDACCEDPNQRVFAQALLDNALKDYFLLQLAMFANTKVNAYVTINRWKNAGLKLPAEGTPEFYPY